MSRTVNGEMLLDDEAKEVLRKQLHQVAEFSGVQVITYAIMTNHFHIMVRIPSKQGEISNVELVRRYQILYPKPTPWAPMDAAILADLLKAGGADGVKLRKQLLARMGDVSQFMKTLKLRFTLWFNRRHKRFGTLWAERFGSTILDGKHRFGLQMMAAYIDLNPVRAGLVKDPKEYQFCGYGEAEANGGAMVKGLLMAMGSEGDTLDTDEKILAAYRMTLFGKGATPKHGDPNAAVIPPKTLEKVMNSEGKLTPSERLGLRVKWFSKGFVIGSQKFVKEHLDEHRKRTNRPLRQGPLPFSEEKTGAWATLFAMRGRH
jgi:REP element-mobilizing transposase RayT